MNKQHRLWGIPLLIAAGFFLLPMAPKASNSKVIDLTPHVKQVKISSPDSQIMTDSLTASSVSNSDKSTVVAVNSAPPKKKNKKRRTLKFQLPVKHGFVSSDFGEKIHPILKKRHLHPGVDIAALSGTEVHAATDGRVTSAGVDDDGYGKMITLAAKYGYKTRYGHLQKIRVKRGQRVKAGDIIGEVGSTGLATGSCLHFEIIQNHKPVNPAEHLDLKRLSTDQKASISSKSEQPHPSRPQTLRPVKQESSPLASGKKLYASPKLRFHHLFRQTWMHPVLADSVFKPYKAGKDNAKACLILPPDSVGTFGHIQGMACDNDNNLYVWDHGYVALWKFNKQGKKYGARNLPKQKKKAI